MVFVELLPRRQDGSVLGLPLKHVSKMKNEQLNAGQGQPQGPGLCVVFTEICVSDNLTDALLPKLVF